MASIVAIKILQMFIILLAGVIAYKTGLINKTSTAHLSNLLLMMVSPLLSFLSYQLDFTPVLLNGLLLALFASVLTYVISIGLSELLLRPGKSLPFKAETTSLQGFPQISEVTQIPGAAQNSEAASTSSLQASKVCITSSSQAVRTENYGVEKIALVYSNCGFFGIPLVSSIFGTEGVFYLTAYLTAFNVLLWTHGLLAMGERFDLKTLWKKLMTPAILAVVTGVICFLLRIHLPEILTYPLGLIANMNTPLAMIVAGANLAQADLLKCLRKPRVYLVSFLRLLVLPALSLLLLWVLHITISLDFTIAFTVFIASACPVGAVSIMFAERFGKDSSYATELFVVSTVLSLLTIPLISIPAAFLLK